MLTHLYIKNYALISHLDIDFEEGFSVLTGETGAGKSIILGALSLVMGGRADTKTITEGESRCVIEATFTEGDQEIIIRRELNANGRSRSLVNDEIVTQTELKALAHRLVDIHSQHENLLLNDDSFQLGIVDAIAQNEAERQAYTTAYEQYMGTQSALTNLRALASKSSADQDYITYQWKQLCDANLLVNEEADLELEQYQLSHADQIHQALQEATYQLYNSEPSIIQILHSIDVSAASEELQERIQSVEIELKDIADECSRKADSIEANPARLQAVEERLDIINSLLKKHHVKTVNELIQIKQELEEQHERFGHFDEDIQILEAQLEKDLQAALQAAKNLSKTRKAVRDDIVQSMTQMLTQLGINHAKVDIAYVQTELTATGQDDVQFLFAANLNQSLRKVSEVASGGEMARIMLSIKALIASTTGLPTIIFDEIDTGVSGAIAVQMGKIMEKMSASRQIIAITHNPQIVVQADTQFLVYKQDEYNHTETHIRQLTTDEREQYIDQYYATISRAIASKDAE